MGRSSFNLPPGKLTVDVLGKYSKAAMQNAEALIGEASLLGRYEHWPRAYFLAVAAIEEIGKAMLAFDAQGRNLSDPAVLAKLLRAITDHEAKIRSAFIGFLALNPHNNVEPAIDLIIALQRGREPAMYTDLNADMSIHVPAAAVRDVAARDCVRLANDCFHAATKYVAENNPAPRSPAEDQFYAMKSAHAKQVMESEDFWWYYIAQLEAGSRDFAKAVTIYRQEFLLKDKTFRPRPNRAGDA